jgi:hypothetical protein
MKVIGFATYQLLSLKKLTQNTVFFIDDEFYGTIIKILKKYSFISNEV